MDDTVNRDAYRVERARRWYEAARDGIVSPGIALGAVEAIERQIGTPPKTVPLEVSR